MVTAVRAIIAIRKAKNVFVVTRLTEYDMTYMKGIKADIIRQINIMVRAGITDFNIMICDDGDVVVG